MWLWLRHVEKKKTSVLSSSLRISDPHLRFESPRPSFSFSGTPDSLSSCLGIASQSCLDRCPTVRPPGPYLPPFLAVLSQTEFSPTGRRPDELPEGSVGPALWLCVLTDVTPSLPQPRVQRTPRSSRRSWPPFKGVPACLRSSPAAQRAGFCPWRLSAAPSRPPPLTPVCWVTELTHLQEPAAEALTQLPASRQQPEGMHGSVTGAGTLTPERGGCGAGSWSGNTDPSLPQASPCVSYTFFPQNFVSHSENPECAEGKTAAQTGARRALLTPRAGTRASSTLVVGGWEGWPRRRQRLLHGHRKRLARLRAHGQVPQRQRRCLGAPAFCCGSGGDRSALLRLTPPGSWGGGEWPRWAEVGAWLLRPGLREERAHRPCWAKLQTRPVPEDAPRAQARSPHVRGWRRPDMRCWGEGGWWLRTQDSGRRRTFPSRNFQACLPATFK